jgi:acetolactate synthase small subunit
VHHNTHNLELTVTETPLVLDRVVSTFRGRRCEIVALRYECADRHRPGRVLATVRADAQRARLATLQLQAMPGVLAVATLGAGAGEHAEVHRADVADGVVAAPGRS